MSYQQRVEECLKISPRIAAQFIEGNMYYGHSFSTEYEVPNSFILSHPEMKLNEKILACRTGTTAQFLDEYRKKTGVKLTVCEYMIENDSICIDRVVKEIQEFCCKTKDFYASRSLYSVLRRRRTLTPEEYEKYSDKIHCSISGSRSLTADFIRRYLKDRKKGTPIEYDNKVQAEYLDLEDLDRLIKNDIYPILESSKHVDFAIQTCIKDPRPFFIRSLFMNPGITLEHIIETRYQFDWETYINNYPRRDRLFPDIIYVFPEWNWVKTFSRLNDKNYSIQGTNPIDERHTYLFHYDELSLYDENIIRVLIM